MLQAEGRERLPVLGVARVSEETAVFIHRPEHPAGVNGVFRNLGEAVYADFKQAVLNANFQKLILLDEPNELLRTRKGDVVHDYRALSPCAFTLLSPR